MCQANNHALGWGVEGLLLTATGLKRAGILPVGAGENREQAFAPAVVEVSGVRVAFVAATSVFPSGYGASAEGAGCATLEIETSYRAFGDPGTVPEISTSDNS